MSQTTLNTDSPRTLDARGTDLPTPGGVIVDPRRARQTEEPATPFRDFLAGGVSVLMGGAAVATNVMGAPRLAAAISGAGGRATTALAGTAVAGMESRSATLSPGTPPFADRSLPSSPSMLAGAQAAGSGVADASTSAASALTASGAGSDAADLATMQAMQRESQAFNMQLLSLQDQVQQDSQRFNTLSNVMRAKHDTAKAAVSNIRS
jgi:hypothetical protein